MAISGQWYGSGSSHSSTAQFNVSPGMVSVIDAGTGECLAQLPDDEVNTSDRLGNTPRYITVGALGKFETTDNDSVDAWQKSLKGSGHNWLHLLESRLHFVLVALVFVVVTFGVTVRYGVPAASHAIANALPAGVLDYSAKEFIFIMDKQWFEESQLSKARQEEVLAHFKPMQDEYSGLDIKVLFRKADDIGANAFALPDGTVIFTDAMVNLAEHNDELLAVLAHEIGHVEHRHSLRSIIQNSFFVFAVAFMFGDVSASADIVLAIPILLTELSYSRGYELEADHFAKEWMLENDIPLTRFTSLMRRLEESFIDEAESDEDAKLSEMKSDIQGNAQDTTEQSDMSGEDSSSPNWLKYLSTHPHMEKRLEIFESESVAH